MKLYKKITLISVSSLALMSVLSLVVYKMRSNGASDELWALAAAVYLVVFPCIVGAALKLIVNNYKPAIFAVLAYLLLWSAGSAVFMEQKFLMELLFRLVIFPIIMLFYFFTHLVVKSKKRRTSVVVMTVSVLLAAFVVWLGALFFLSLLGWQMPPESA